MPVRILLFLVALALVLPLTSGLPASAQTTPFEINTILALTGPAAFIGSSEQKALQILEDVTNKAGGIKGRPIKFVVVDDQSNPAVSVQLVNGLIGKKIPVILGPTFTATCQADGPLIAKTGPVDYCFSPSISPAAGSFQYSATVSTRNDARALAHYYRDRGWTKVALMTTTDASGQQFEQYFDEALALPENAALKLVAREHWAGTDLNITAQAEHIKASGAQAMIGWSAGTATATLLRGLHDTGVDIPVACGNGNMIYEQLAQYAAFLPTTLLFPGRRSLVLDPAAPKPVHEIEAAYFAAFKAAGVRPNLASTLAWDPASMIVDAFKKLGTNVTADQLNDYIQHLNGWVGINGSYDYRDGSQRGIGIDGVVIDRWDAAKDDFVVVSKPGGGTK
jgi:branched-chain amino acid transport system substrate-binding protein